MTPCGKGSFVGYSIVESQAPNQVSVVVSGEVPVQEILNFIATHRAGDQRQFAFLFDITDAAMVLTAEQVRQLASFAAREARSGPMGPVAFISTNPGPYGMMRMYQAYSGAEGRHNVGVFHTLADAQAWLKTVSTQRSGS
jgi:hypothetical protein